MQANYTDDLAVDDGDQDVVTLSAFFEKFTNRFEAAVRQLQRVADRLWCGVTFPDSFGSALRMEMSIFSRSSARWARMRSGLKTYDCWDRLLRDVE